MVACFAAPQASVDGLEAVLRDRGFAVLAPAGVAALAGVALAELELLAASWDDLRPDAYLKDGGRYRKRRHSCFVADAAGLRQVPHRMHWQSLDYNALHGGMQRWFDPVDPAVVARPAWSKLLLALARVCSACRPEPRWSIEAHQFRIDTADGVGRPTPEGAHRDGVDFVAVVLVARNGIKGGETRVFQADGPDGQRFTLAEPWSLLLLDDAKVIHESTPIQPLDRYGHRDTLVLTYRAAGFQGDDAG
ncbi:MAG: 2OG-Fe dioxygenase family protein [Thermomonas sp.]|uniref:2OG-Fe dioxygenase family protein n=1 Tax=Thermomonas sp. TaxID=1971895 RepID=UPI001B75EE48|nr:2OG-Fe dioxygenase family protein [Thermomonas sp.]MBK6415929.1 2OG-Fe dioxygenase family protein [Thermomonas sp.]MBK7205152.1 2OG-Fe dioxygenase family protein [Thermomonas sp.]MBP7157361.1 2OG-Fe dioxygenase family protein [Thermomonas sp.]MBP8647555.1 2OG-Fe dioxygenase family protein [Thermomonas sp.]